MFKISGLLCLAVAIVAGTLLFHTSQSVQNAEQNLTEARNNVATEKESLRILTAEWDYLNRPERLEKLTLQNLDMDEARAEKIDFIEGEEEVPEPRVPVLPTIKPKDLLQYVGAQKDKKIQNVEAPVIKNAEREGFDSLVVSNDKEMQE